MEKIAENFYRTTVSEMPSDGVMVEMIIDIIDGEYLDTAINLNGKFTVAGECRVEFLNNLGSLIYEYIIYAVSYKQNKLPTTSPYCI